MAPIELIIEPDADDPDFASVLVNVTVAGRPYRLLVDTGAARTQLPADDYTSALPVAGEDASSGSFGGRLTQPVVTVTSMEAGPLRIAALDVARSGRGPGLLGMDVLGRCRCHFRLHAGLLDLQAPPGIPLGNQLTVDRRGHPYVELSWPGVTARACWDTGAGPTIVDRGFWLSHPELFEPAGESTGTDSSGDQATTPLLLMAGPVIGERTFTGHKAVAVDLSPVNSTLEIPMDLIVGYPTIVQADWLFDFPARRWALTGTGSYLTARTE